MPPTNAKKIHRRTINRFIERLPKDTILVGSYSRGIILNSDIDILTTMNLDDYIKRIPYKIVSESGGEKRKYLIVRFGARDLYIDLFKTTKEHLPYAKFHYIGNKQFNIRSRALAKRKGLLLNQYGIFRNGKQAFKDKIKTERDIFNILGITYKKPTDRNE